MTLARSLATPVCKPLWLASDPRSCVPPYSSLVVSPVEALFTLRRPFVFRPRRSLSSQLVVPCSFSLCPSLRARAAWHSRESGEKGLSDLCAHALLGRERAGAFRERAKDVADGRARDDEPAVGGASRAVLELVA